MVISTDCRTSPTGHPLLHIDVFITISKAGIISFYRWVRILIKIIWLQSPCSKKEVVNQVCLHESCEFLTLKIAYSCTLAVCQNNHVSFSVSYYCSVAMGLGKALGQERCTPKQATWHKDYLELNIIKNKQIQLKLSASPVCLKAGHKYVYPSPSTR